MPPVKVYKPIPFISFVMHFMLAAIFALLLAILYGLTVSIIDEIQRSKILSLPPQDIALSVLALITMSSIMILGFVWGLSFITLINISVHVREDDFRVTSFLYKSEWLTWDRIIKTIDLTSILNTRYMVVDGLGWVFTLASLTFWVYPYSAIQIGEKSMVNGIELMAILKRKRRDLYY